MVYKYVDDIVDNFRQQPVGTLLIQPTHTIAVLGLGEAGSAIARDLVHAGIQTRGWDPVPHGNIQDIPFAQSGLAVVAGVDIVLSVNMAAVARQVAQSVVDVLFPQGLYADLNTASPQLKYDVAAIVEASGARFVDVALMAPPTPRRGGFASLRVIRLKRALKGQEIQNKAGLDSLQWGFITIPSLLL